MIMELVVDETFYSVPLYILSPFLPSAIYRLAAGEVSVLCMEGSVGTGVSACVE